jgi:uncharacterized protein YndB with AHSA1/START domain
VTKVAAGGCEDFDRSWKASASAASEVAARGEVSTGQMTYPGYEHYRWHAVVKAMEPERRFAFAWCPYSDNPDADYSREPQTPVEFRLEPTSNGTRLHLCESGFAALPDDPRRAEALRMNTEGWEAQARNIAAHVEA